MNEVKALWRLVREPELIRHNQNAVYSAATVDGDLNRFIRYRVALLYCWCRNDEHVPRWMSRVEKEWRHHLLRWSHDRIQDLNLP